VAGRNSLIRLTSEPAGANCAAGGQRIDVGVDLNGDGSLDVSEIQATGYVCNAASTVDASAPPGSCHALKIQSTSGRVSLDATGWGLGTGNWTLEYWIKVHDEFVGQRIVQMNEAYGSNNVQSWMEDGRVSCNTYKGVTGPGNLLVWSPRIDDGQWHHIACVRAGSVGTMFVDGLTIGSGSVEVNLQTNSNVAIGKTSGYTTPGAPVLVGPVRFSSAARYTGNFTPSKRWTVDASTVAQYLVDQGFTGSLIDEAGGDNNSTAVSNIAASNDTPCN
jgi:hypothetical protein